MIRAVFVALCVLVALLVAIAAAPASLLAPLIPANTQRLLRVHQLDGTVWRGQARFSVPVALAAPQAIAWRCMPSVFSGALTCEFSGAISGTATLRPFGKRIELQRLVTAQTIQFTPNAALSVSASPATLNIARASVSQSAMTLEAGAIAKHVNWRSGGQSLDFGEVSVDCKPSDATTSECAIRNRATATPLDGKLSLSPQRISGYVEYAANGAPKQRLNF